MGDKIALFDLDGSLADYDFALRHGLRQLFDDVPENLWECENSAKYEYAMDVIRAQSGWWANLQPIQDGMEVFRFAERIGFDCQILTKGPRRFPAAWKEKVEWCQKYFGPNIDIHVVTDKKLVYGRLLYDDYPEYMLRWLKHRPRGVGIMPVNECNKDFTHPNVVKWDGGNLGQVEAAIRAAFDRE